MDLDPIDIGNSIVGRIVRGLLMFLLSGFIGVIVGSFCVEFDDWSDFLEPHKAIPGLDSSTGWLFIFWPVLVCLQYGVGMILVFPFLGYTFVRSLFSELLPFFTLLVVTIVSTAGMLIGDGSFVSWCVFGFLNCGYLALGWMILKIYHSEKIDAFLAVFDQDDREIEAREQKVPSPKKVGLKAWGEKVELEDEEWETK